jgi:hypothetical protein
MSANLLIESVTNYSDIDEAGGAERLAEERG